jgi:outer membrane protein assembly factor BamB
MIATDINQLLFVGFASSVAALNRESGQLVWKWACEESEGDVAILVVDNKRMFVSADGYTYCLNPMTGEQLWYNEMEDMGTGHPTLAIYNP